MGSVTTGLQYLAYAHLVKTNRTHYLEDAVGFTGGMLAEDLAAFESACAIADKLARDHLAIARPEDLTTSEMATLRKLVAAHLEELRHRSSELDDATRQVLVEHVTGVAAKLKGA